jgi:hypothetical protein
MTRDEAWALLGIEPTNDTRSIKRTYALLLKKIDVDIEKLGFLKLRRAFDLAIVSSLGELDDHFAPLQPMPEANLANPWIEPDSIGADPAHVIQHASDAKRKLLTSVSQTPPPEDDVMRQQVAAFFDDPEIAKLNHADSVDDWLVCTIVDHFPQSDALIEPAISFCGWDDRHYRFDPYSDLATIFQRRRDLRFRAVLENPNHKWHRAFQLLCAPPENDVSLTDKIAIRGLLDVILVGNSTLQIDINKENLIKWLENFDKHRREFAESTHHANPVSYYDQQQFYEKHPIKAKVILYFCLGFCFLVAGLLLNIMFNI